MLEVGEDVGHGALVVHSHKVDVLVDAVVETADVQEVSGSRLSAVQSRHLACACVRKNGPEVKSVFSLARRRCMKTCSTSRRMSALTYAAYGLSAYIDLYKLRIKQ